MKLKQEELKQAKLNCSMDKHDWSNWFTTPAGLAKECKHCGKVEFCKGLSFS